MAACTRVVHCDSNNNTCSSHIYDENRKYMYSEKVDCSKFCNGGCNSVIVNMLSTAPRPNPLIDSLSPVSGPGARQQVIDAGAGRFATGLRTVDPALTGKTLDELVLQLKVQGKNIRTISVPVGAQPQALGIKSSSNIKNN